MSFDKLDKQTRSVNPERACVVAGECRPRSRAKKDRKRWCGGKVGREHVWQQKFYDELPNAAMVRRDRLPDIGGIHLLCATCGRQDTLWRRGRRWRMEYAHRACRQMVHFIGTRLERSARGGPDILRAVYRCDTCNVELCR